MKEITTDDGSTTFYNEQYDDIYHSKTGAIEESFGKFAIPALKDRLGMKKIRILDICFGLGYNTAAAIDYIYENSLAQLEITALEIDEEILSKIADVKSRFSNYDIIRKSVKAVYRDDRTQLTIKLGDARETIKEIEGEFDVVFFDPFAPSKHPDLWTAEFFKDIYNKMSVGASLHTYSCARIVRDNLKTAGFEIIDGPKVGRRAPSTIAIR